VAIPAPVALQAQVAHQVGLALATQATPATPVLAAPAGTQVSAEHPAPADLVAFQAQADLAESLDCLDLVAATADFQGTLATPAQVDIQVSAVCQVRLVCLAAVATLEQVEFQEQVAVATLDTVATLSLLE